MIIYKGDKYNTPIIVGIGVATDIANTKFRQLTGTTISRLKNCKMFEGLF